MKLEPIYKLLIILRNRPHAACTVIILVVLMDSESGWLLSLIPVVLNGCHVWSPAVTKEDRWRTYKNMVLRTIFGPNTCNR
jgi:hypothetical protein